MMQQPVKDKIFTGSFLLVFLCAGLIRVSYQMQNTLMPLYMGQLGYSASSIGLTTTVCTIASLLLRPLLGSLLDRYGRKAFTLAGTGLFGLATLLCGLPGGFAVLLALRALQGFGFSAHTTAVNTMATDLLPAGRMAEGIGYMGLTGSVSSALAPAAALAFVAAGWYRAGFFAAGAAGLLGVLCILPVKGKPAQPAESGTRPSLMERLWEKNALKPTLVMLVLGACNAAASTFLATFALGRGYGEEQVSLYFTINAIAMVIARLFGGKLSEKMGLKATLLITAGLNVAGYLLVSWCPHAMGLWIAALMLGFSYGTLYPMMNAMAVTRAPAHRRGVAMATFLTGMDIGIGFGAAVWGFVIDACGIDSIFPLCAVVSVAIYALCRAMLISNRPRTRIQQQSQHGETL